MAELGRKPPRARFRILLEGVTKGSVEAMQAPRRVSCEEFARLAETRLAQNILNYLEVA